VSVIEVVAGERIGAIRLGMKRADLPPGTVVEADVTGAFEGIHFMLERDAVNEVWIPNLRAFAKPLSYNGRTVVKDAQPELLKAMFGPCSRMESIVGGVRYACAPGIALGLDFEETGAFVQLRVHSKS
jgi:hypothetical protein